MSIAPPSYVTRVQVEWDAVPRNSYLRSIPALRDFEALDLRSNLTFLVGENGTGKSTLLEAIAIAFGFNPEGGTRNHNFSTYRDDSGLSEALDVTKTLLRPRTGYFFRAESFFNVATQALEYWGANGSPYYGDLHAQSHGESFLSFFQAFGVDGLYIMDEPEAALSPQRQLSLLYQMTLMAHQGAQFIVATHSPILLGAPGADIVNFDDCGLHRVGYEETDAFRVMDLWVRDRGRVLHDLFGDELEGY